MGLRRLVIMTVLVALCPGTGWSQVWCVDADGSSDPAACGLAGSCEAGVHPTVADALAAIEAHRAGAGPGTWDVCIDGSGPHVENLDAQPAAATPQDRWRLHFARTDLRTNWCPASDAPMQAADILDLGEPLDGGPWDGDGVRVVGADATVVGLRVDRSGLVEPDPCGASPPVLLRAWAADVTLERSLIQGWDGVVAEIHGGDATRGLLLDRSRVEQGRGSLLRGAGGARLLDSEVSGLHAPTGAPVVDLQYDPLERSQEAPYPSRFSAAESALVANLATGAPIVEVEGAIAMAGSLFALNVASRNADLMHTLAPDSEFPWSVDIRDSIFSRNRTLDGGSAATANLDQPLQDGLRAATTGPQCLAAGSTTEYDGREEIDLSGATQGAGALLGTSGSRASSPGYIAWHKTFVVGNQLGAVLRPGGELTQVIVSFIHNTIDTDGPLLEGGQTTALHRLAAARNLFPSGVFLTAWPPHGGKEAVLDVSAGSVLGLWEDQEEGPPSLLGPALAPFGDVDIPFSDSVPTDDEARVQVTCPDLAFDDPWGPGRCLADLAAQYVPTAEASAAVGVTWPFATRLVVSRQRSEAALPTWNTPGATGWDCHGESLPQDEDGDGYTTLVDCSDVDPEIIPLLPTPNGFDADCEEALVGVETDCYICPEAGSAVPPDTGSPIDGPECDPYRDACCAPGCGAPFGLMTLALFTPGLRRRPRRR